MLECAHAMLAYKSIVSSNFVREDFGNCRNPPMLFFYFSTKTVYMRGFLGAEALDS